MKYKVAIILTVFTGIRLGELMGLDWKNIDFYNKEIAVNKPANIYQVQEFIQSHLKHKVRIYTFLYLILSLKYLENKIIV